jgi:glycosyltransferase involved in cell wall biosynthesis
MSKKVLSIVIPVFNNGLTIDKLYSQLCLESKKIQDRYLIEVIFVNDGSTDDSIDKLFELVPRDFLNLRIIDFSKNFGQAPAIMAGLEYSKGEFVIVMSADLQDPISLIPNLVELAAHDDTDIVLAHRSKRSDGIFNKTVSRLAYKVARFNYPTMPEYGFDYFLVSRNVIDAIIKFSGYNRFIQGDILWTGYKFRTIEYERVARPLGKSQYTLKKRFRFFMDIVFSEPSILLRIIAIIFGITSILFTFILTYLVVFNQNIPSILDKIFMYGLSYFIVAILLMNSIFNIRNYLRLYNKPYFLIKNNYLYRDNHFVASTK